MSALPAAVNAAISKTREKLFARPSAGTLDELGVLQLAQGDLRRARLSFQRAVELDSARAAGHAGLGVALARLGELAAAREAYRAALELDPTLDRAHAGLAALRCRAGDEAGARDELSRVRQKPEPATPDVDPELFKCAGGK